MTNAIKKQGQPCFFICRCWQCAVTQNATMQTYVCNVGNKTVPFAVLYSLPSTVTKRHFWKRFLPRRVLFLCWQNLCPTPL